MRKRERKRIIRKALKGLRRVQIRQSYLAMQAQKFLTWIIEKLLCKVWDSSDVSCPFWIALGS